MLNRRTILASGAALAATTLLDRGSAAWAAAGEARSLKPLLSPPPITPAERIQRLARAKSMMRQTIFMTNRSNTAFQRTGHADFFVRL